VKVSTLQLTNTDTRVRRLSLTRVRRLSLTAYVEWTLGVLRDQTQHLVRTSFSEKEGVLYAYNTFDAQFAGWSAYCALSEPVTAYTADRREFIGRNGTLADPAALHARELAGTTGADSDPCAALQCQVELQPGESARSSCCSVLSTPEEAERVIRELRVVPGAKAATAKRCRRGKIGCRSSAFRHRSPRSMQ
jgi:cyclic beta-1,2-glucan synthetase